MWACYKTSHISCHIHMKIVFMEMAQYSSQKKYEICKAPILSWTDICRTDECHIFMKFHLGENTGIRKCT